MVTRATTSRVHQKAQHPHAFATNHRRATTPRYQPLMAGLCDRTDAQALEPLA
jgi:hypothetical protein